MNIPSFHIPMTVLAYVGAAFALVLGGYLLHRLVYRRGYAVGYDEGYAVGKQEGQEASKLAGAYCDVCGKVSEKFVAYKMHVVCQSCFASISSNKEMKCKFCNNHVEQCSCT
jgi:hypothetical protein